MNSGAFGTPEEPSTLAKASSHALVGICAGLAVKNLLSKLGSWAAVLAAVVAMIAHEYLDAPVARLLASLNFG